MDVFCEKPESLTMADGTVAEELLEIASNGRSEAQRIRALRSLARACVLPIPERADGQRLLFLEQAMELANRPDEIELITDRAKAIRTVETLRFLMPTSTIPSIRNARFNPCCQSPTTNTYVNRTVPISSRP